MRRSVVGNISSIVRTSSCEYGGGGGLGIAEGECWTVSLVLRVRDDAVAVAAAAAAAPSGFTTGAADELATAGWLLALTG